MKIQELFEGSFVVKNKDGKEKRFKDADSVEAKAFKVSSTKKASPEKYSKQWWIAQEEKAMDNNDHSFVARGIRSKTQT